jgi:hypothetical protein
MDKMMVKLIIVISKDHNQDPFNDVVTGLQDGCVLQFKSLPGTAFASLIIKVIFDPAG